MGFLTKKVNALVGVRLIEIKNGKERIVIEGSFVRPFLPKKELEYIVEGMYEEIEVPFWRSK